MELGIVDCILSIPYGSRYTEIRVYHGTQNTVYLELSILEYEQSSVQ